MRITSIERRNELIPVEIEGTPYQGGNVLGRVSYEITATGDGWQIHVTLDAAQGIRSGLKSVTLAMQDAANALAAFVGKRMKDEP